MSLYFIETEAIKILRDKHKKKEYKITNGKVSSLIKIIKLKSP